MKEIKNKEELNEILQSAGENVVCVKYHAAWCGPCKVLNNIISKLESDGSTNAVFVGVDVDGADEDFVAEQGIRNIPVIQFYKNSELADKSVGLLSEQALLDKINEIKNK